MTTTAPVSLSPPSFVFPLHPARHDAVSFPCPPCPSLPQPAVAEPKQRSPSRTHAHRRSAAVSHDFLADLKQDHVISPFAPPLYPPSERDRQPSPPASPCRSSSASLASSSAASLASVSSASTSPPSKAKVMFSPSVEFIPSHSSTTSTSTTTTITAARASSDLADEAALKPELPQSDKRQSHKKLKSWSFIRFRRWSTEEEDEDDDEDDDEVVPPARPATPPRTSHSRATHYFTRSGTPEPMIDLDAALGPDGTPTLLSGTWSAGAAMHRRAESAPEMLAWTGTKSVDFGTFSNSISRIDGSRGMKRKMSAVVEVEESPDAETAATEPPPDPVVVAEPERRRSVWDEFVNSFAIPEGEQADTPSSLFAAASDEVVVVDEFGDVIVIGEPGPEIRHELSDNANSLHNSSSVSTFSDARSVSSNADIHTVSEKSKATAKRHSRRRSLVLTLKNAMLKSQSVGNLLHMDDHKPDKQYGRRHSKLDTVTGSSNDELGRHSHGWRSHGNLSSTNTSTVADPPCPSTTPSKSTASSSSLHSQSPARTDSTQQSRKSKGMAYRVWDWVRGIIA
ncbi:hypothetical protein POJ06DRAFT_275432 [Lipomyces tetrasporus]|uniref:Uncharacterized protein n=1 Tax=Lipomyces tetrasporus TaxID=54092 RepID=A0AAD7QRX3_9ASCO|nr:uncharacterized protein POJ06DRAFT_275432 [Lipomyces tetrasporus]KAJ8100325.1 hypothetical protein POJ06DRAFT_275432 [Lipomyces tetrasporus]